VKTAPAEANRPTAFFAGALVDAKGVGDCLQAVSILRRQDVRLSFEFAGAGDVDLRRSRAAELDLLDQVQFLGPIANAEVRLRMAKSDIVVIPSRHDYPEGLPNTIYEALASRTPAIISDHPAFANRLRHKETCMIFRASDPASLADEIAIVLRETSLFKHLSERSAAAHRSLYVGMEWTALVSTFLQDPANSAGWVEENSLARLVTPPC
jgi:glycosyltransferase involved in cell wall biosynthesis